MYFVKNKLAVVQVSCICLHIIHALKYEADSCTDYSNTIRKIHQETSQRKGDCVFTDSNHCSIKSL